MSDDKKRRKKKNGFNDSLPMNNLTLFYYI